MLKVLRPPLAPTLQAELDRRQAAVDNGTAGNKPWKDFTDYESTQIQNRQPTVKDVLETTMFHGKCAYCETNNGREIEHYWPKAPHPHNARRGSPAQMFRWANLVWACHICNGFECKGSHMEWNRAGRPKLLNPTADDPLGYLTVNLSDAPDFTIGWLDPRGGLSESNRSRAEYTLSRLKLNQREDLRRGRAKIIQDFLGWLTVLQAFGPDFQAPSGYTVRQRLLDLLAASEPYLAPVRQIFYAEPDYAPLHRELLEQIPELGPILAEWALPPNEMMNDEG